MRDPELSEFEPLLAAGRSEVLPPELRAQMARALDGAAPAGLGARSAAPFSATLTVRVLLSLVGLSGLAWYALQHPRRPQPMAADVARLTSLATRERAASAPVSGGVDAAPPTGQVARAGATTAAPNVAAAPIVTQPPWAVDDAAQTLGAEVALLDRARRALREREGARASAILSDYQHRFARAALRPEADVLQIEALLQRGSTARARQLAQRFIADHPTHPLSDRARRLLASAPER